jgi:hypothetical protein
MPPQQQRPMGPPPPIMYQPMQPPKRRVQTETEVTERRRVLLYSAIFIAGILVIGLIAGIVDSLIRNQGNFFLSNLEVVLLIVASSAPWAVIFFLLCLGWVYLINRLFVKWNTSFADDENDEAYGKGIIYEIVRDNNGAAAVLLVGPLLILAVALLFIVTLIK